MLVFMTSKGCVTSDAIAPADKLVMYLEIGRCSLLRTWFISKFNQILNLNFKNYSITRTFLNFFLIFFHKIAMLSESDTS